MTCHDFSGRVTWYVSFRVRKDLNGHPNVVEFYEAFFERVMSCMTLTIVMELCWKSLFSYLNHYRRVADPEIVFWTRCLCKALLHAHAKNICHRDVKPDNCLLQYVSGSPGYLTLKLCDFGASAILVAAEEIQKDKRQHLNTPQRLRTTFAYAPPEVLQKRSYSFSCDMWGVGIILHEMMQENLVLSACDWREKDRPLDIFNKLRPLIRSVKDRAAT